MNRFSRIMTTYPVHQQNRISDIVLRTSNAVSFFFIQLPLNSAHEKRDLPHHCCFGKFLTGPLLLVCSPIDDPLDFDGTRLYFLSLMAWKHSIEE